MDGCIPVFHKLLLYLLFKPLKACISVYHILQYDRTPSIVLISVKGRCFLDLRHEAVSDRTDEAGKFDICAGELAEQRFLPPVTTAADFSAAIAACTQKPVSLTFYPFFHECHSQA